MAIARSAPEVSQWLAALPHERRAAVEELRALARAATASLYEIVYHGALGYSTSVSGHDRVVYVSVSTNHMTLGFFFGTSLTDLSTCYAAPVPGCGTCRSDEPRTHATPA